MVRAADPERFILVMMAPPCHREALFAVLALNIEAARIPETVSEPILGAMRFRYWRDVIEADMPAPVARGNPVAEALVLAVLNEGGEASALRDRREVLEALLDGWENTLGAVPPADEPSARAHADAIGGSLWDLCGLVVGVSSDDAMTRRALRHVGTAWLLLGVARATPALLHRGRLLMPVDVLAGAGVSAEAVLTGSDREKVGVRAGVGALTRLAGEEIAAAKALRSYVDPVAAPLLRQAITVRHLARHLRRWGYDPFAAERRPIRSPVLRLTVSAVVGRGGL